MPPTLNISQKPVILPLLDIITYRNVMVIEFIKPFAGITNSLFHPLLTHRDVVLVLPLLATITHVHTGMHTLITFSPKTMVLFSTWHSFCVWCSCCNPSLFIFMCVSTRPSLLSGVVKRTMSVASASSLVTSGSFTSLTSSPTSPWKPASTTPYWVSYIRSSIEPLTNACLQ